MDRRMRLLVVLAPLASAGALAGCVGDDAREARPAEVPSDEPFAPAEGTADAPVWSVGDAWNVVMHGDGEPRRAALVVTAADADGYVLSTTDEGAAVHDALHDVSYLGRIRASDLAGSQEGEPVAFFSFPLADGKTWTARWDGREIALTARWDPALVTSAGIHAGFVIEGVDGTQPFVKYDYVPALKWWSRLAFANGFGFEVERVLAGWSGPYASARAEVLLDAKDVTPVASPHRHDFTVSEGAAALAMRLRGSSSAQARALLVLAPDGRPHPLESPSVEVSDGEVRREERLPPTPGPWKVVLPVAQAPDGAFHLLVRQVALVPARL